MEIEFDSLGAEPDPWWKPFFWVRNHREAGYRQDVLRFGALGVHIGFSAAHSVDTNQDTAPKEDP